MRQIGTLGVVSELERIPIPGSTFHQQLLDNLLSEDYNTSTHSRNGTLRGSELESLTSGKGKP
jgi:hypothetical protein